MKRDGFALLVVFFITFLLSIVTFSLWYKSSLLFDLTISRERFYKHYYLTQVIFDFAIKYVSKRFDFIVPEDKDFIDIDLSFLLKLIDKNIDQENNLSELYSVNLNVRRNSSNTTDCIVSVVLIKSNQKKDAFLISCKLRKDFFIEELSDGTKEKKEVFAIKNYTVSSII